MRSNASVESDNELFVALAWGSAAGLYVWEAPTVDADPSEMRLVWMNQKARNTRWAAGPPVLGQRLRDVGPNVVARQAQRLFELSVDGGRQDCGELAVDFGRGPERFRWSAFGLPARRVAVSFEEVGASRAADDREESHQMLEFDDDERIRLAMVLRDDVSQGLTAARVLVEGLLRRASSAEDAERLSVAIGAIRASGEQLRRVQFEVAPLELVESDVEASIRGAVDVAVESPARPTVSVALRREPPPRVRLGVVRVLVDLLRAATWHMNGCVRAVTVSGTEDALRLTVDVCCPPGGHRRVAAMGGLARPIARVWSLGGSWSLQETGDGLRVEVHVAYR